MATDANELVEEFMLLSNIAVAQHIAVNLPEQALLRRHDTPLERRLVSLFKHTFHLTILMSYRIPSLNVLLAWDTKWMSRQRVL